jgi:choline dehydrogenase-like flavoprotein
VAGIYQEESIPWHGPMMSQMVESFTNLEQGYGFRIETPPLHPGLFALAMPWASARQFESDYLKARNLAVNIVLTRDKFGGTVQVNKKGALKIKYKLHPFDRKHLVRGVQESTRMHATAEAHTVKVLHQDMPQWRKGETLESFIRSLPSLKWSVHRFPLFSAHQMGTCRMSGNKKLGVVQPNGQLWGHSNIWVADASVFPSASGANPMLSVQAIAYWVARQFLDKYRA